MGKFSLPEVTLCAVASVNVAATVRALQRSADGVVFARSLLFTDAKISDVGEIQVVSIPKIRTAAEYSRFVLHDLIHHVSTSHCLIVQWDGFVLNPNAWDPAFLDYDYVGAPWPQFDDGKDVGNGGFSLRSRKLLEACGNERFRPHHPEDVAICRTNHALLEDLGMRFAPRSEADRFSFERTTPCQPTFGFHGIFNMIPALGADEFWQVYGTLDDRRSAVTDFGLIMRQLGTAHGRWARRFRLGANSVLDRLRSLLAP